MLKKAFRLRKTGDFDRAFQRGKPLFFGEIGCRIAKNDFNHIRLGFSFSKKHLNLAVERNRLRRVLSEGFSGIQAKPLHQGVDIVFFTTSKPKKVDSATFRPAVESIIEHINH